MSGAGAQSDMIGDYWKLPKNYTVVSLNYMH